jgi:hypothetical protein
MVEDFLPGTPTGAMGFVYDNEVKEISRKVLKKTTAVAFFAPQILVNGKVQVVIETESSLAVKQKAGIAGAAGKGAEGVIRLVAQNNAIGQKEDAAGAAVVLLLQPAGLDQLPHDLKSGKGLTRAGSHRQQDTLLPAHDAQQNFFDGHLLKVARYLAARDVGLGIGV